jgi:hypothetical protein
LQTLRVELPAEGELDHQCRLEPLFSRRSPTDLAPDVRACIDSPLVVFESAAFSAFEVVVQRRSFVVAKARRRMRWLRLIIAACYTQAELWP